jgi:hypothetical protein
LRIFVNARADADAVRAAAAAAAAQHEEERRSRRGSQRGNKSVVTGTAS